MNEEKIIPSLTQINLLHGWPETTAQRAYFIFVNCKKARFDSFKENVRYSSERKESSTRGCFRSGASSEEKEAMALIDLRRGQLRCILRLPEFFAFTENSPAGVTPSMRAEMKLVLSSACGLRIFARLRVCRCLATSFAHQQGVGCGLSTVKDTEGRRRALSSQLYPFDRVQDSTIVVV